MADAPNQGRERRKVWVALTASAVIVAAIGIYIDQSPQAEGARRVISRITRAIGRLVGKEDQARKPIEVIVREIKQGDQVQRTHTILSLNELTKPAEFAQVFPDLIRAMKDESEMVREAAASVVGDRIFRLGSTHFPVTDERDPTIFALCQQAEEALALLLNESSPIVGCDLRLMSSATDATGIPQTGKSLIVVADVDHVLQFRIFNGDGKVIVDTDEKRLREPTLQIERLRKRLEGLWPPHELTKSEKDEVVTAVRSVVDRTSALQARAATSLGFVAEIGKLDAPPPQLVACLDDEAEEVRSTAAKSLIWYRQGPELLVPVALRRLPSESPGVRDAFTDVFWFVRLEPSVLALLIEGLSSKYTEVCLSCTAAINHMGRDARPALPAILTLIRKELEAPHPPGTYPRPRIIAMASGAVGELLPDTAPQPGTVELLCEVLKRPSETGQASAPNHPALPFASEEAMAEAAWSLGILGRFAASAVPVLLSTFETAPETSDHNLRELIAESLAEITRGTADEDRVIAILAKAWKTAPKQQKAVLARALRSLGPKSEQLVPELRKLPLDETGSRIRRVRYPRSRRGQPVRE